MIVMCDVDVCDMIVMCDVDVCDMIVMCDVDASGLSVLSPVGQQDSGRGVVTVSCGQHQSAPALLSSLVQQLSGLRQHERQRLLVSSGRRVQKPLQQLGSDAHHLIKSSDQRAIE